MNTEAPGQIGDVLRATLTSLFNSAPPPTSSSSPSTHEHNTDEEGTAGTTDVTEDTITQTSFSSSSLSENDEISSTTEEDNSTRSGRDQWAVTQASEKDSEKDCAEEAVDEESETFPTLAELFSFSLHRASSSPSQFHSTPTELEKTDESTVLHLLTPPTTPPRQTQQEERAEALLTTHNDTLSTAPRAADDEEQDRGASDRATEVQAAADTPAFSPPSPQETTTAMTPASSAAVSVSTPSLSPVDLGWLLPLVSGWSLESISVEAHLVTAPLSGSSGTTQPWAAIVGRPSATRRKRAARKTPKMPEHVTTTIRKTVFRVVLRHVHESATLLELLVPVREEAKPDTRHASAAPPLTPPLTSLSVDLTDPALTVYDVTHGKVRSVADMRQQLLTHSFHATVDEAATHKALKGAGTTHSDAEHAQSSPASVPPPPPPPHSVSTGKPELTEVDVSTLSLAERRAAGLLKRQRTPSPGHQTPPNRSSEDEEEVKEEGHAVDVGHVDRTSEEANVAAPQKRGRGRPPKSSSVSVSMSAEMDVEGSVSHTSPQPSRGPGRPHKGKVEAPEDITPKESEKRPRGRPRRTTRDAQDAVPVKKEEAAHHDDADTHGSVATSTPGTTIAAPAPPLVAKTVRTAPASPFASLLDVEEALQSSRIAPPVQDQPLSPSALLSEMASSSSPPFTTTSVSAAAITALETQHNKKAHLSRRAQTQLPSSLRPRAMAEVVFKGHRLSTAHTSLHPLFDMDALSIAARRGLATTARRRSTSPARTRTVSPGTPAEGAIASRAGSHASCAPYLTSLHALRSTHGEALRRREAAHHLGRAVKSEKEEDGEDAEPRSSSCSQDAAWEDWLALTRAQSAQQGVRQWMLEGLELAVPSPRLNGDVLAAGIHALDIGERDTLAYTGHTSCTTPASTRDTATVASQLSDVHLPGLAASSVRGGSVPAHVLCLAGSLNVGACGDSTATELSEETFASFPRPLPPEFLPVSGFALLQAQERAANTLSTTPFSAAVSSSAGPSRARCVIYADGIPSAPPLTIGNTFRDHSTLRVLPSSLRALRPSSDGTAQQQHQEKHEDEDREEEEKEKEKEDSSPGVHQHAVVPNPFCDVGYYVHRRLLSHRLREMLDEDGVLAITSDGVYPDTETVKAHKRAQVAALQERANAVRDEAEARALEYTVLADLAQPTSPTTPRTPTPTPTPTTARPSSATVAFPSSLHEATDEPIASLWRTVVATAASPLTSPASRGPVDDSEAVGDQVDKLLRRGHDISRVPMPSVEWSYGPA